MTVPKKPLTKNESAIQLGNILKGGPRGGGSKKSVIKNLKKLLKIGKKPSKVSKSTKVTEVQTRPKQSLQNQNVNEGAKKPVRGRLTISHPQRLQTKEEVWNRGMKGKMKREDGIRKLFSRQQLEGSKNEFIGSGIPHATGRLLKQKKVLKNQKPTKKK